jgi:hypothetical protein
MEMEIKETRDTDNRAGHEIAPATAGRANGTAGGTCAQFEGEKEGKVNINFHKTTKDARNCESCPGAAGQGLLLLRG